MILYDATHTSHTRAQTGIQRVTRSLYTALATESRATAICHDPFQQAWRPCTAAEIAHLHPRQPASQSRGSRWSFAQRLGGRLRRWTGQSATLPTATGLICPEIFPAKTAAQLPALLARVPGPRIALFYDAIPLQYPELTPAGTVARFPAYLRELLQFDGIAAISETSAHILRDYWAWLGVTQPPPVQAIPLAIEPTTRTATAPPPENPAAPPRLLCVSTIEGRKNHRALLEACETLWRDGLHFELQLIGLARPDTARPALDHIAALQQVGRPLIFTGAVDEAALTAAYQRCTFTVYPSLIEGFGLPVLESLHHGKPCVCSAHGALGESARDGGCLTLDTMDGPHLATALRELLQKPSQLTALTAAARARPFKTWTAYATDLTTWMQTLPRRS